MKRFFCLLLIIAVASHFGTIQFFAQKRAAPREVIVIEYTHPQSGGDRHEILINRSAKTNYRIDGGAAYAGGIGCGDCSPEEFEQRKKEYKEKLEKLNYGFTAKAWRMGKDKSQIYLSILLGENCRTQRIFMIYRDRPTKIQLGCGVKLTAYYGLESEKTD